MARRKNFGDLGGDLQPFTGQGLQGLVSRPAPAELVIGTEHELSTDESLELERCETIIERGLKTFMEVGTALTYVRDLRLYRVGYATFEAYCDERWGLKRQRAYELMGAANVVQQLSEISDIPVPERESHAAALAKLHEPTQQREAWRRVVETAPNGRITAAYVEQVVQELRREQATAPHGVPLIIEQPPAAPLAPAAEEPAAEEPAAEEPAADPNDPAVLQTRITELEQQLAALAGIIAEYREHIVQAQDYPPTSASGVAVSPFLRLLERVGRVLGEGGSPPAR